MYCVTGGVGRHNIPPFVAFHFVIIYELITVVTVHSGTRSRVWCWQTTITNSFQKNQVSTRIYEMPYTLWKF